MDNACIESFNGSFRDGCLNVNWSLSLEGAEEKSVRSNMSTITFARTRHLETCS